MKWAPMPEASINENRQARTGEEDVYTTLDTWAWPTILKEAKPISMES